MINQHPFDIKNGHLMIGGLDTVQLAAEYGTPLYVYDVDMIRGKCRAFVETFKKLHIRAQVAYASKAFSSIAMLQVVKQEGLSLDVISEGELYTALQAGFPPEKIHLHGNNKSKNELEMAIHHGIGCIVIDNFHDITLLDEILTESGKQVDVLMRVTPGIEADTHRYIMTGNEDSKFGFNIHNGQADEAFIQLHNHPSLHFKGLHCHIGSQIFANDRFILAAEGLFALLQKWKDNYDYIPRVLNFGGGFGIRYTGEDQPLPLNEYVEALVYTVREHVDRMNITMPEIWIEPGRSIAGEAGITLYTLGASKHIPGIRDYVSVDGGMTDNIRPALYGAKYDAIVANKANMVPDRTYTIAGKCCESGDVLIKDLQTPVIETDDILAIFSTGAYGYAMASHYNRLANAAVIFVEQQKAKLVVKRETYQDIVRQDLSYE